jgi:hypothetical protein
MAVTALPRTERLLVALQRCLHSGAQGMELRHPLVTRPYNARFNGLYNRQYQDRVAALRQAKASRNWERFVWLHERPYRVTEFRRIARRLDDDQYWRMLAQVWVDAGESFAQRELWTELWTADRYYREQVMTDDEHDALAILPESSPGLVTIYRGCADAETINGLSWAVSRRQASAYATRFATPDQTPVVATATIAKSDVQAYFVERKPNEAEIVALPHDFQSFTVESVRSIEVRRRRVA